MEIPVIGLSFGEKASDEMFYNLKAELYWRERQYLLGGGRLIKNPSWSAELPLIKYKNRDGKIIIQPKEELFKQGLQSPNVVDAAVLTMYATDTMIKSSRLLKMRQGQFSDKMIEVWRGN